jgi:hypothetical protein
MLTFDKKYWNDKNIQINIKIENEKWSLYMNVNISKELFFIKDFYLTVLTRISIQW